MTAERWVKRGIGQYNWSQCRYCGRASDRDCQRVECMLCGSPQCHGNGLSNGSCAVCFHGYLPGWSRGYNLATSRTCTYKGCDKEAVATARKRAVCIDHAARIKVNGTTLAEYVAKRLDHRDSGKGWEYWRLVT